MKIYDAHQLWSAAIDHSQAVLTQDRAERRARDTESDEDHLKVMEAWAATESARSSLMAHIAKHITEETGS